VSNHGVDEALIERCFKENRKFFALSEQEKRQISVDENSRCAASHLQGPVLHAASYLCAHQ